MHKIDSKKLYPYIILLLIILLSLAFVLIINHLGILKFVLKIILALYPVFLAILFSFLFEPSILFLTRHHLSRPLSVIIIYGFIAIVFVGICFLIIPSLINQIKAFIQTLPSLLIEIETIIVSFTKEVGFTFDIRAFFSNMTNSIKGIQVNDIALALKDVLYFSLSFVGAIFLSFDYPLFKRGVKKLIPRKCFRQVVHFLHQYLPFIYKYIKGMLLDSLVLFVLASISFLLIGLEYPFIFALVMAFFNLIPLIGGYLGGGPAVIVAFTSSTRLGLTILIAIILLQLVESNFIQPFILRNIIQLHPFEGIVSLIICGTILGVVGMVLSPLLWTGGKLAYQQYDLCQKKKQKRRRRFVRLE